ncbi:MAG: hypothetical protein NC820_08245, partial [Candidatus Omnitrophica bacterium]|nr:hypothetical protein [Candidatus Omnitrophota bacterium]
GEVDYNKWFTWRIKNLETTLKRSDLTQQEQDWFRAELQIYQALKEEYNNLSKNIENRKEELKKRITNLKKLKQDLNAAEDLIKEELRSLSLSDSLSGCIKEFIENNEKKQKNYNEAKEWLRENLINVISENLAQLAGIKRSNASEIYALAEKIIKIIIKQTRLKSPLLLDKVKNLLEPKGVRKLLLGIKRVLRDRFASISYLMREVKSYKEEIQRLEQEKEKLSKEQSVLFRRKSELINKIKNIASNPDNYVKDFAEFYSLLRLFGLEEGNVFEQEYRQRILQRFAPLSVEQEVPIKLIDLSVEDFVKKVLSFLRKFRDGKLRIADMSYDVYLGKSLIVEGDSTDLLVVDEQIHLSETERKEIEDNIKRALKEISSTNGVRKIIIKNSEENNTEKLYKIEDGVIYIYVKPNYRSLIANIIRAALKVNEGIEAQLNELTEGVLKAGQAQPTSPEQTTQSTEQLSQLTDQQPSLEDISKKLSDNNEVSRREGYEGLLRLLQASNNGNGSGVSGKEARRISSRYAKTITPSIASKIRDGIISLNGSLNGEVKKAERIVRELEGLCKKYGVEKNNGAKRLEDIRRDSEKKIKEAKRLGSVRIRLENIRGLKEIVPEEFSDAPSSNTASNLVEKVKKYLEDIRDQISQGNGSNDKRDQINRAISELDKLQTTLLYEAVKREIIKILAKYGILNNEFERLIKEKDILDILKFLKENFELGGREIKIVFSEEEAEKAAVSSTGSKESKPIIIIWELTEEELKNDVTRESVTSQSMTTTVKGEEFRLIKSHSAVIFDIKITENGKIEISLSDIGIHDVVHELVHVLEKEIKKVSLGELGESEFLARRWTLKYFIKLFKEKGFRFSFESPVLAQYREVYEAETD